MLYHHFDKDAQIDDHVIYQLAAYHDFKIDIIFISNAPIPQSEQAKVEPYVKEVYLRPNRGFDWGAWGEILTTRGDALLAPYAELILANCTCYGPLFPIEETFTKMASITCDFWTPTTHPQGLGFPEHGQPYFACFKPRVFNSPVFRSFFSRVTDIQTYWDAVWKGEIALHAHLVAAQFTHASVVRHSVNKASAETDISSFAVAQRLAFDHRLPLLKIKAFLTDAGSEAETLRTFSNRLAEKGSTYPCILISRHLQRTRTATSHPRELSRIGALPARIAHFISQHVVQRFAYLSYGMIRLRCLRYGIPTTHVYVRDTKRRNP